jgi:PKD repeat protein
MASAATLQALVSGLPASASFALDIGANGSTEWSGTVANASTHSSPDLAAAFNAFWVAQGAPVSGNLDVPVKVTMSQPGQVLLSNLQFSTAGSKQRTLRLNAGAVTQATLDLALGGSGQQAISTAVDVGADGSLDWTSSLSTTLPVRLTTGNLAAALTSYLAGKSGLVDAPIRIYVAPDVPVALYDASITTQPAVDLAAGGLGVGGGVAASGAERIENSLYLEGERVPVQATLSNASSRASGPVTAAFFATAAGWGDWYIGSAFVANIPANGSAPVSILWDTTGFSGNVPVKVVVNPYGRTGETSTTNNMATTQVNITPLNPPPAVDFSATPTLGGAPLSVQFSSVVTNSVTSYAWNFGDGQTSSAAQPSHSYAASGVYTVTLTVSGPGGSVTQRKSSYITVTNTPTPPIAAFSATPLMGVAPLAVTFVSQSTGTVTAWEWNFGDGVTSTASNPSHQYSAAGVYTVSLKVSGPSGEHTAIKTAYIQVTAPPAAPVAAFNATPTTGIAPVTVQFSDASTGSITGWTWEFGDGATSNVQHPVHLYEAPGVYTVRLTVSGPGGSNSVSKSALIQVSPDAGPAAPLAQFTFTPAQATAGQPVQFTDQSSGTISTWLWNFGDGQSSREQNPLHTYASAGVYTVTLTVYAKDELSSRSETTVVVGTNEALPHRLFLPALSR